MVFAEFQLLSPMAAIKKGKEHHGDAGCLGQVSLFIMQSGKLAQLAGKWTRIEDDFPIENGGIPASYVGLPDGNPDLSNVQEPSIILISL